MAGRRIFQRDPYVNNPVWRKEGFHFDFVRKIFSRSFLGGGRQIFTRFEDLVTFTRAGTDGSYVDENGIVVLGLTADTLRYESEPSTLTPNGAHFSSAATNLVLHSHALDDAVWVPANSTVTADTATSPANDSSAELLTEDGTAGVAHTLTQSITYGTTTIHSISFWAKPNGRNWVWVEVPATVFTNAQRVYYNVSTGVVGTTSGALVRRTFIEAYPNGWYRCHAMIGNATSATTVGNFILGLASADNTPTYNGDNTSGAYFWGAQVCSDGGFYPNYIPTTTTTITVPADSSQLVVALREFYRNRGSFLAEVKQKTSTFSVSTGCNIFTVSPGRSFDFGSSSGSSSMEDGTNTVNSQGSNRAGDNIWSRVGGSYHPSGGLIVNTDGQTTYNLSSNGIGFFDGDWANADNFNSGIMGGFAGAAAAQRTGWCRELHIFPRELSYSEIIGWCRRTSYTN